MSNIWDEESISEYELIAEDAEKAEELAEVYSSIPAVNEASEEVLDEIAEQSSFKLNKKESHVIYNARLRLEQAKLYEMLINHNLFDGVDASSDAINNVQNELKVYIVKRLEILLGLREPVVRVETTVAQLPFNDVEIDFLKQLAYKGTLGASENGAPVIPKLEKQQTIKSLVTPKQPVSSKLKGLSIPKKKFEDQKEVLAVQTQEAKASLLKSQIKTQPIPKSTKKSTSSGVKIRASGMGRELSQQEAEILAKEEIIKNPLKKPFHEMTAKEKAERIREVNEKYKRPSTTTRIAPMPSLSEIEMKYTMQQQQRSLSKNQTDQFNTILATALSVQKNRGEEDND